MVDLGTGNNNKINWAMNNKQVRLTGCHLTPVTVTIATFGSTKPDNLQGSQRLQAVSHGITAQPSTACHMLQAEMTCSAHAVEGPGGAASRTYV
jgi:hypothetical protein